MKLNYQLTKILKFAKNEIPKLQTKTNLQYYNSIKKNMLPQASFKQRIDKAMYMKIIGV